MTARLRELAQSWASTHKALTSYAEGQVDARNACADELLAILDAVVAVSEELSEVWVVQDETGQPVHCASWPEACHEHINDAINEHGIEEAKAWKVLHYANGTTSATKELQPDEDYVSRLWNAMGQAHPTKSSLRAALAFLSPSTSPARSGGVSDADVEECAKVYDESWSSAKHNRECMRDALEHFAKGVEAGVYVPELLAGTRTGLASLSIRSKSPEDKMT